MVENDEGVEGRGRDGGAGWRMRMRRGWSWSVFEGCWIWGRGSFDDEVLEGGGEGMRLGMASGVEQDHW